MRAPLRQIRSFVSGVDQRDEDFWARLTQLKSDAARCDRSRNADLVDELRSSLEQLSTEDIHPGDIDQLHRVEAELCLVIPRELLRPTWWRLREKLYRLESRERDAWEKDMARLLPEGKDALDDDHEVIRLRLHRLALNLYTAATNFRRIAEQRARVLRSLTLLAALWVVAGALLSMGFYWWFGEESLRTNSLRLLPSVSLAGIIGGAISAVGALIQERAREELVAVLQWQLALRSLVAGVSAGFVYLAVSSGFVKFNVPLGGEPTFFLALGFASGFSERIFAQAISPFVIKRDSGDGRSSKRKKDGTE